MGGRPDDSPVEVLGLDQVFVPLLYAFEFPPISSIHVQFFGRQIIIFSKPDLFLLPTRLRLFLPGLTHHRSSDNGASAELHGDLREEDEVSTADIIRFLTFNRRVLRGPLPVGLDRSRLDGS